MRLGSVILNLRLNSRLENYMKKIFAVSLFSLRFYHTTIVRADEFK
jgi:hypothetical protein